MSGVALHAIQPAAVHGHDRALHVDEIVLAHSTILSLKRAWGLEVLRSWVFGALTGAAAFCAAASPKGVAPFDYAQGCPERSRGTRSA
jgi:hypothetical protein